MANTNTLANAIPQILAQGLMALRENAIMPRLVNSDYSRDAAEEGDTIDVPIPSAITAAAVTPSYVPPDDTGVVPTKVSIALDQWIEAPFFLSDKDIAEAMKGIIPMQASEAIKALANYVDQALLTLGKSFYGAVGTAGTTPFASDVQAAVDARKLLSEQLAPVTDRRVVLDPAAEAEALMNRAFQDTSWRGDERGIIEGQINRKFGFDWFQDQNVQTMDSKVVGTVLVDQADVAVGDTTVHFDGITTAAVAGEIFTVAGDTQQYVITEVGALATNDQDWTLYPPAKVAWANDAAVTPIADNVMNLAFHRDAIAFATRKLEAPGDGLGSLIESAVDPVSGLTLRLEISRQHRRTRWAFDILYGLLVVRKEYGVRILG